MAKIEPTRVVLLAFLPLLLILASAFLISIPSASADSPVLVQENDGGCGVPSCTPIDVAFPNPVASGDVVVVAISSEETGSSVVSSVTDSLSSTYTLQVHENAGITLDAVIYAATLSASGSDTVQVNTNEFNYQTSVYIYEVSGITTTGAGATGAGNCSTPPCSISTTSSVSFASGSFLVAIGSFLTTQTITPGTGFTLLSGAGGFGGYSEYSTSGVTSPTSFLMSVPADSVDSYAEAGIALAPTSTSTSTTSSSSSASTTTTISTMFSDSFTLSDAITTTLYSQIPAPGSDSVGFGDALSACSMGAGHESCAQPVTGGTVSSDQTSVTGVSVDVSGASGSSAMVTTQDFGGSEPAGTGVISLSGAVFYDVHISGISGGTATVCITPAAGASAMQYFDPVSKVWVSAGSVVIVGSSLCGQIPVDALTGTYLAIGTSSSSTSSTTETSSSSTTGNPPPLGVPQFPWPAILVAAGSLTAVMLLRKKKLRLLTTLARSAMAFLSGN